MFTKDLTKNPEIENTPVLRLSNLKRQGRVSDIEFDISVFNEKFFDAAKCFVVVFCISASYLTLKKKKNTLQNARFSAFTVSQLLREFHHSRFILTCSYVLRCALLLHTILSVK